MAFRMRMRKGINIGAVVKKIVYTILALWVGGTIITEVGKVMNGTCSPFYKGLSLIGWTVGTGASGGHASTNGCTGVTTTITDTTNNTGILSVIGIIGIASVVMEFVQISW